MLRRGWFWIGVVTFALSCAGPTSPKDHGGSVPTAPVIRSITVPGARVEAGQDVPIAAVVEDAETPVAQLTFRWTASAGTITGAGTHVTWRMPKGATAGVNVTVTLTVTEAYQVIENLRVVAKEHVVSATSPAFRVHDTDAETRELARKFLVDLFGNSSVPAEACMMDFAAVCAALPEGKNAEYVQIVEHRRTVLVYKATVLVQRFDQLSINFGSVHTAMLYDDQEIGKPPKPPTCADFEVTVVYDGARWWICESYFNEGDLSHCPANTSNTAVARILRGKGGTQKGQPRTNGVR